MAGCSVTGKRRQRTGAHHERSQKGHKTLPFTIWANAEGWHPQMCHHGGKYMHNKNGVAYEGRSGQIKEGKKMGKKWEGKGQWYHDTLTLMTCKWTIAYLRKHDLLKYWVLPLQVMQEGTRYNNSIPGDSPELMPLDETLNMDIHSSAKYQVALTDHLPNDNTKSPARTSTLLILKPMAPLHQNG
jgi:hypothetical protein